MVKGKFGEKAEKMEAKKGAEEQPAKKFGLNTESLEGSSTT